MIRVQSITGLKDDTPEPRRRLVVVPFPLLERAVEALASFAHFAGDARMLGLEDPEVINPFLDAGTFRFAREVRRELMEELGADPRAIAGRFRLLARENSK